MAAFAAHEVAYLVVGGQAVGFHARPWLTGLVNYARSLAVAAVMLVNTGTPVQTGVTVTMANFATGTSAKAYQSVNGAAPAAADVAISGGAISGLSIAANSITLLVASH